MSGLWRALRGCQLTKSIAPPPEFTHSACLCPKQLSKKEAFHAQPTCNGKSNKSVSVYTFGEHLKCIPGTGRVVMYIVIQRYM